MTYAFESLNAYTVGVHNCFELYYLSQNYLMNNIIPAATILKNKKLLGFKENSLH